MTARSTSNQSGSESTSSPSMSNRTPCSSLDPGGSGKAKLVKETSGTIRGTWGKGSSATDGGAWVFTP